MNGYEFREKIQPHDTKSTKFYFNIKIRIFFYYFLFLVNVIKNNLIHEAFYSCFWRVILVIHTCIFSKKKIIIMTGGGSVVNVCKLFKKCQSQMSFLFSWWVFLNLFLSQLLKNRMFSGVVNLSWFLMSFWYELFSDIFWAKLWLKSSTDF